MKDTQPEIYQKQFEIIFQKSVIERFAMIEQLQNTMRQLAEQRIKQTQPNIDSSGLVAEIFKTYYEADFSPAEQIKIMESIREYHQQKQIYVD
ncbi:MAG: hypothetical protein MUE85_08870 [Microscillaceae bacterium]|jgi:hypothetical protein|nr:hypothetical protein [Microscillaceae bacterium]